MIFKSKEIVLNGKVINGKTHHIFENNTGELINGIIETVEKTKMWIKDGLLHRENGPAVEYPNGSKIWYLNGKVIKREILC